MHVLLTRSEAELRTVQCNAASARSSSSPSTMKAGSSSSSPSAAAAAALATAPATAASLELEKHPLQHQQHRQWNTKHLSWRIGVDAFGAACAGALVAPVISIIDR